jgi:hypothetical protein
MSSSPVGVQPSRFSGAFVKNCAEDKSKERMELQSRKKGKKRTEILFGTRKMKRRQSRRVAAA